MLYMMPLKAVLPTGFAFHNTIYKTKLSWPDTSGSLFNAAHDPQGSKRLTLTCPGEWGCRFVVARGACRAALGFVPRGFTFLGVPAFMPFVIRGADELPKFPISTK